MNDASARPPDPADDRHLRVSDREREDVVTLLAEAATDGRLTLDEYGDRSDKALTSVTREDLAVLTRDLADDRAARVQPVEAGGSAGAGRMMAVFGSEERRGRWAVPSTLQVLAVFGGCTIELHRATLHSRVTVLDVKVAFGSVEIVVPEGVEVRMSGLSIFGSRTCSADHDPPPGAPVLEVRSRTVFGEVTVRYPRSE